MRPPFRTVVLIWLAWALVLIGYQAVVAVRVELVRPDRVLPWTDTETTATAQDDQPYLLDPFLNHQVSWDSEFYLSIAGVGYDDPLVRATSEDENGVSLNYAFMPFYPHVIRFIALPLSLLDLTPIATGTLAGVIVSALGTLAGMLALFDLARDELGDAGGVRAAFYLLIFPGGFFLLQVYTEGLFVGLAFSSLALIRRRRMFWASLLAVFATWTKAAGIALAIPLALAWIEEGSWTALDLEWKQLMLQKFPWRAARKLLLVLAPAIAFFVWRLSYWGFAFGSVETAVFGRGLFSLTLSAATWSGAFRSLFGDNAQAAAYYLVEFVAIVLGLVACLATLRRFPGPSLFGLAVIFLSLTSGPAQGMHRYVLAAPSVFLFLGRLGKNPAFDRAWTAASIMFMGLFATMFTFDMWAG